MRGRAGKEGLLAQRRDLPRVEPNLRPDDVERALLLRRVAQIQAHHHAPRAVREAEDRVVLQQNHLRAHLQAQVLRDLSTATIGVNTQRSYS